MKRLLLLSMLALTARVAVADDAWLKQSKGAGAPKDLDAWRAEEKLPSGLKPYPPAPAGTPNPVEPLYKFGGRDRTSYAAPTLNEPFATRVWKPSARRSTPRRRRRSRRASS